MEKINDETLSRGARLAAQLIMADNEGLVVDVEALEKRVLKASVPDEPANKEQAALPREPEVPAAGEAQTPTMEDLMEVAEDPAQGATEPGSGDGSVSFGTQLNNMFGEENQINQDPPQKEVWGICVLP